MKKINQLVNDAKKVVIVQADNPDGDSLSSALALEQILGDQGKDTILYCGVEIPSYLRYMQGWDRIVHELPKNFDLSIIVDTSASILLETLDKTKELSWLKAKPCVVIDHHKTEASIDFASVLHVKQGVSTTELIYELSQDLDWKLNQKAKEFIAIGILADSMGLTSEATKSRSIHILGDLVEAGVSLASLDNLRRQMHKKHPQVLKYKGQLLERIRYSDDGKIAYISIPWEEIEKYSYMYNPSMLVLDEMRQVQGVCAAVAFKSYPGGRITGKVRANYGHAISDKLAEHFGGGGHPYASGFRITDGRTLDEVIKTTLEKAGELLEDLKK
jgi:bifunctional oligoribonuclease and PAP phosphatase NrnA